MGWYGIVWYSMIYGGVFFGGMCFFFFSPLSYYPPLLLSVYNKNIFGQIVYRIEIKKGMVVL